MPKFWVTIVDNRTTDFLIEADDIENARAIAEEELDEHDDIVELTDVVDSEWYIKSITEDKVGNDDQELVK